MTTAPITIDALLGMLSDMATMLEMLDENPFKIRALQTAVRALEDANFEYLDLEEIAALQGIGKGTLATIREFAETGAIKEYSDLQTIVPALVLEMTHLRGLGAKKVRVLWKEVGIASVQELSDAVNADKISSVKGFGAKTQANIAEAIKHYLAAKGQFHLHKAWLESEHVRALVEEVAGVSRAAVAGEAAQGAETVRQLVIVVECTEATETVSSKLRTITEFAGFQISTENNKSVLFGETTNGFPCRIILAELHNYALALHEASSTAAFHAELLKRLETSGNKTSEERVNAEAWHDETDLYRAAALPFAPAELRIKPALLSQPTLSDTIAHLATDAQMRGILHVHSTWSDGKHSIRQMAERAQTLGYEYIAICDHSKTAVYARGLTEERVKAQHEEIDRLNEELNEELRGSQAKPIRILKGIESDILRDGSLDYNDAVLDTFDVVVASVHSSFSLDRATMTDRVCRALEHPATTLLGHPTGRLLLMRKGYELDMEAVLDTAKAHHKAIEINASPYRLDLTSENAALAQAWGVRLAINTDAHNMDDLGYMRYGIQVARRAGLSTSSVINALTLKEFCAAFGIAAQH